MSSERIKKHQDDLESALTLAEMESYKTPRDALSSMLTHLVHGAVRNPSISLSTASLEVEARLSQGGDYVKMKERVEALTREVNALKQVVGAAVSKRRSQAAAGTVEGSPLY